MFAMYYFDDIANMNGCMKNDIELPADISNLPDLQAEFINALNQGISDKLYYFHGNHLGSGSLITDNHGDTYQTFAYAPHGESLVQINHYYDWFNNPYRYSGKIKDEESGLHYFEMRYLWDGGIFISTDPHWFNYPWLHSYNYSANNPIMYKDTDGRDIIVLLAPGGANGAGHMGVLIGNNKDGWVYMSKDGANNAIGLFGESKFNTEKFPTLTDFQLSKEILREKPNGNGKPYEQGIYFETTSTQDNTAMSAMEKAGEQDYNVFTNNCADAVGESLKSIGIDPGYNEKGKTPLKPNNQFENIKTNNNVKSFQLTPIEPPKAKETAPDAKPKVKPSDY
jgi:RHS repeat-associated protein